MAGKQQLRRRPATKRGYRNGGDDDGLPELSLYAAVAGDSQIKAANEARDRVSARAPSEQ